MNLRTVSALPLAIAVSCLIGCAKTTARLGITTAPDANITYDNGRNREAHWALDDGQLLAWAKPIPRRATICEPHPMTEAFAHVVAFATWDGPGIDGNLLIILQRANHQPQVLRRYRVFSLTVQNRNHVQIRARNEQDAVSLDIEGPPEAYEQVETSASQCLAFLNRE